ncbi:zinc finger C3H1 domain-containing protein-like protein [Leptotrombidium deliense]|uniref:Zinc finger C3H1 domain-containing protein-like protein n=1 Tax=Leptotrombidium deliense TaxID=299467 RepID=A0A443S4B9_9ACAR|nr:zinc finger C3H1 domain-containing protein-like protein [Leptotrombidium deliense]
MTQEMKLIIRLDKESSDEEDCDIADEIRCPSIPCIDYLLKEARKAAAVKPVRSNHCYVSKKRFSFVNKMSVAQQQEYKKLKEEIAKREQNGHVNSGYYLKEKEMRWKKLKALIHQKRQKLVEMKVKSSQKRLQLKKAQTHARKMQELYAAATKAVTATAAELNKCTNDVKLMDEDLVKHETMLTSLEKECISEGLAVEGNTYKLPLVIVRKTSETTLHKKRLRSESEANAKSSEQLVEMKKRVLEAKHKRVEKTCVNRDRLVQQKVVTANNVNTSKPKVKAVKAIPVPQKLLKSVNKHLKKPHLTNVCTPFEYLLNFAAYPSELAIASNNDFQMPIHSKTEEKKKDSLTLRDLTTRTSVLSHLHSFRLSNYFEEHCIHNYTKPEYASSSYTNAINPHEYLCRFDLLGTCNDENCPWQHCRNYLLNDDDKLIDLLLYKPAIAHIGFGKENGSEEPLKALRDFVANFRRENIKLTDYELQEKLVRLVRSDSVKERPVCVLTRCFPRVKSKTIIHHSSHTFDDFKYNIKIRDLNLTLTYGKICGMKANVDPDNYIKNRFYAPEGSPLSVELETTLASETDNIQLWIKLAYYHVTSNPNKKVECIHKALNVLSRGLDWNRENCELWEHYLFLYANRFVTQDEEAKSNLLNICKKAVTVCPRYAIWKLYLSFCVSVEEKQSVSTDLLDALCSGQVMVENDDDLSHCLLEVITYKLRMISLNKIFCHQSK